MWYVYIYIYTHNGLLLSHKKGEILSFATTQVELENIILSEISHIEKDYHDITYMWNLKN